MTANPSKLQRLLVDDESTWAENVTSMSGAVALPVIGAVEFSINQPMVDTMRTVQYRNQGTTGAPGPWDITFSYDLYLCGHGTSTAGAGLAVTDLETHLGYILGGGPTLTAAAGDTVGVGSTTTSVTTTGANGFTAGGLFRCGAKGDSGADGQWSVVTAHAANALTTRVAFPAAPANAAVVYGATNLYTVEDGTNSGVTLGSKRFQLFTANNQYIFHGCFPTGLTISQLNPGEMPKVRCSWRASWVAPSADTFPETTSMATHTPAPVAAGSLNLQTYATTTRNALSYRSFSVDLTLGTQPLMGPDGVNSYQTIVGARRTVDKIAATVQLDAAAASTTPTYWANFLTNAWHHLLWSGSVADGSAVGLYLPRVRYTGARPTQGTNGDLNSTTLNFEAHTNDQVTTSAMTLSALRIGMA